MEMVNSFSFDYFEEEENGDEWNDLEDADDDGVIEPDPLRDSHLDEESTPDEEEEGMDFGYYEKDGEEDDDIDEDREEDNW